MDFQGAREQREQSTHKRKISRRMDDNPGTQEHLTLLQAVRTQCYLPAIDRLSAELDKRFPKELEDWRYLQPQHFFDDAAEGTVSRLAKRYRDFLQPDLALSQWRIFRYTPNLEIKTLAELHPTVPESFESLKMFCTIFLTLPITTSTLERGLSKLPIVKKSITDNDESRSLGKFDAGCIGK